MRMWESLCVRALKGEHLSALVSQQRGPEFLRLQHPTAGPLQQSQSQEGTV